MASIPSQIGAALSLSGPFRSPCQGKVGMQRIRIREASWPADSMALETVRCEVFVKEQNVSRSLEFDGLDAGALHWLAFTPEGEPVGTLRLLPSGQIGRAAVLRAYRGQGIGSRLLRHAIAAAEAHGGGARLGRSLGERSVCAQGLLRSARLHRDQRHLRGRRHSASADAAAEPAGCRPASRHLSERMSNGLSCRRSIFL